MAKPRERSPGRPGDCGHAAPAVPCLNSFCSFAQAGASAEIPASRHMHAHACPRVYMCAHMHGATEPTGQTGTPHGVQLVFGEWPQAGSWDMYRPGKALVGCPAVAFEPATYGRWRDAPCGCSCPNHSFPAALIPIGCLSPCLPFSLASLVSAVF